jgi:predicted dehydrogenase
MAIRLGISGACGRGGKLYERLSEVLPEMEVCAVCDVNAAELGAAKDRLRAREAYTDYDAMVGAGGIDAVLVGTPMQFHAEQAVSALEKNIHVLSEVTAAVSIEECRRIVRAAKASTATYMMAENYIYSRPNSLVTELVRRGLFGELYYAEGEYLHELKGLNEITKWRRSWQTGVDGVTYGTHSLGPILQWFRGQRVVSVSCAGSGHHYRDPRGKLYENEDSCLMLCRLSGGGLAKIRVDMLSDRPHAMTNYQLQGTDGCYESARAAGEKNRIWLREEGRRRGEEQPSWMGLEELEDRYLPESWRSVQAAGAKSGHGGGDYFELREFAEAIRDSRPPLVGIHEAMDLTLAGLVSQQSIQAGGQWLSVPDSRSW